MSIAKDESPENIDGLQLGIPDLYVIDNRMFYHHFKTSNELCTAGLFTYDSESISKKHRKMKCNFCHSVLSGWKDKFCKHLDKCERAQSFFSSHPENTQFELLQRKAKREHIDHSILPEIKRPNVHGELFNLSFEDYLTFLATGFICSTGVSRSIFDNEFLRNLCFSLHWQPPSLYTIQKRITDFSKLIRSNIDSFLSSQQAVTLIVYPWVDINKKYTVSYLACSSTGILMFFNTVYCSQDSWCTGTAFQQVQTVIQSLKERNIHVTMVYYDETLSFEDCKLFFQQNTDNFFLPVIGNTVEWCKNTLSLIFSHSSFLNIKQIITLLYQTLSKPSPIQDAFFTQNNLNKKDFKFITIDDDNWPSLFIAIRFILDFYNQIVTTIQYCIASHVIQFSHPLASTQLDEGFCIALMNLYECFNELASCCNGNEDCYLNYFSVYCVLSSTQQKIKNNTVLLDVTVKYALSILSNCLEYFNQDILCILYFFTTPHVNDIIQFSEKQMIMIIKSFYHESNDYDNCIKEFELFLKESQIDYNWSNIINFWNGAGKTHFPLLSKIVCIALSYPCIKESYAEYAKIKTYIHLHVRSKKDGESDLSKSNDELVISCNRHLVIRWNLDFQYVVCFNYIPYIHFPCYHRII